MTVLHMGIARDLPDAGGGACCIGSAACGPERCTCWEIVHDVEQAEPKPGPPAVRARRCSDCAFRSDSPENQGDERYVCDAAIEALARPDGVFYCHDGMRRAIGQRHPAGVFVPSEIPDAYAPATNGVAVYRADGRPGLICAGFAAERRRGAP